MNVDLLLTVFFETLGINLPAQLVLLVGISVTYSNWHRHPIVARWAMLAFVSRLANDLLAISWHTYAQVFRPPWLGDYYFASLFALSCGEAIGYVLFLAALNAARTPYRPARFFDDDTDDEPRPPTSADGAFTGEPPRRDET